MLLIRFWTLGRDILQCYSFAFGLLIETFPVIDRTFVIETFLVIIRTHQDIDVSRIYHLCLLDS